MVFSTIFFDLDDTLYPSENGLWKVIRKRMTTFMREYMDLPQHEIDRLRQQYFTSYGTTLRGLQIHHNVDTQDFLSFVHDVPLEEYLKPDPNLRELLLSLSQKRWIFTNADRDHALRVMNALQVRDCFEGITDVIAMDFHCKPELAAYKYAMQQAGVRRPEECVYLDDSIRNLEPALQLGFLSVKVGNKEENSIADRTIENILDLPIAVPELWE